MIQKQAEIRTMKSVGFEKNKLCNPGLKLVALMELY
jgi:hypothetical protein